MRATKDYTKLLVTHSPAPIDSERAYESVMHLVKHLMLKPRRSKGETQLLQLLAILIKDYEQRTTMFDAVEPREVLEHLMEEHGLSQTTLAKKCGMSTSTVSEVLSGRREMTLTHMRAFAKAFHVAPRTFMP